jgi:hypothetical protein
MRANIINGTKSDINLIISGAFKDAVSISDDTVSNGKMIRD